MRIINSDWKKLNVALGRGLGALKPWNWAGILVAVPLLLTAVLWVMAPQVSQAQGAVPAQPTGLTATPADQQAALTWDDPSDSSITGYEYLLHGQVAKLTASDGAANDEFGYSVAVDGNTAVVGAYGNDGLKGAAYVLTRQSGAWNQVAKLTAFDGAANDEFGYSVAVDGDTVVVGTQEDDYNGAAYVFTKPSGGWATATETAKLTAHDGADNDYFGFSVAVDGDTVMVGAHLDDDNGADSDSVYVYEVSDWAAYEVSDWAAIPNSAAGETNATSYTVTGLTNDSQYGFRIRATNGPGASPASDAVTVTPAS